MGIADFDSMTWSDPWFRSLKPQVQRLFIYTWTNNHKLLSGLYHLPVHTITTDLQCSEKDALAWMDGLAPKVLYDRDEQLIFVVNHIKRQFMRSGTAPSPKISVGIQKSLMQVTKSHVFISTLLSIYPMLKLEYPFPLPQPLDMDSGYPISDSGYRTSGGEGKGKGVKMAVLPKYTEEFEAFWTSFPQARRQAKGAAFRIWTKRGLGNLLQTILGALEAQKQSPQWQKEGGKYIPLPTTWLNQDRWEDEVPEATGQSSPMN